MPNDNIRRFDQSASTWDENPARVALAEAIATAIRAAVPLDSTMDAMDYGCGTGLVALALRPYLRSILGVDLSTEMLRIMDQKASAAGVTNVTARCLDLTVDDLGDARYPLVVSAMALHHVSDASALVARLAATLTPGGHLCIADLDTEDGSFHPDKTGIEHFGFSEAQMAAMFAAAGLASVRTTLAHTLRRPDANGVLREYRVLLTVGEKPL